MNEHLIYMEQLLSKISACCSILVAILLGAIFSIALAWILLEFAPQMEALLRTLL